MCRFSLRPNACARLSGRLLGERRRCLQKRYEEHERAAKTQPQNESIVRFFAACCRHFIRLLKKLESSAGQRWKRDPRCGCLARQRRTYLGTRIDTWVCCGHTWRQV